MDFTWADEHQEFRGRLGAVVDSLLPRDWAEISGFDNGSETTVEFSKAFCAALGAEGLLVPHWPKEIGGGGLDPYYHWILTEEMISQGEPRAYQYMSINWVGPGIAEFGSPEQKAFHLPRICAGTISYCQGFSEPEAGSDLAALRTRAEPTQTGFRINGRKIWTSAASFADYCVLLARTGENQGSRGISVFLIPMDLPGITVRRIPSLQGQRSIHEVFFDDVEVPRSELLGEENQGWGAVRQMLANERVGAARYPLTWRGLNRTIEFLRRNGRLDDVAAAKAAKCETSLRANRLLLLKVIDMAVKGKPSGAAASVARYSAVRAQRLVAEFIAELAPELLYKDADVVVAVAYRRAAAYSITAGTAEIQLNQISRQVLNLPKGA